jgi:sulfotransferase 6B1
MKNQRKVDRYIIFSKRVLYSFLRSFTISKIKGRFSGPKIFANSIPKSGTNLLEKVFYQMPVIRYSSYRTLRKHTHSKEQILKKISFLKNGTYQMGHVDFDADIVKQLHLNNFRTILMIRDPRQIIISHYKYVSYIDTNHPTYDYFKNLKDDNDRLLAVINGVDGVVESIDDVLSSYEGWVKDNKTLVVKFEDLIGEHGGGSDLRQNGVIKDICKHIDMDLTEFQIKQIANKIYDKKSPTFRAAKIDSWKEEFSIEQKAILKKCIGNWLIKYGYEENLNW